MEVEPPLCPVCGREGGGGGGRCAECSPSGTPGLTTPSLTDLDDKGHATSLSSVVWQPLQPGCRSQQDLRAKADQLDAEVERGSERLTQLARLREEATQREGSVGAARRALDEVEELLAKKVRVLRAELEAAAVSWQARAEEEHEQLARGVESVRALAESMRNEEDEGAHARGAYEEALNMPLPALVGCDVAVSSKALATLHQAVADLAVISDGVVSCGLCEREARESSMKVCEGCKHDMCGACVEACVTCLVTAEKESLPEAVRHKVVIPANASPYSQYSVAIAVAYNTIGEVWSGVDNNDEALRLHTEACTILQAKAPTSIELAKTYNSIGNVYNKQGRRDEILAWHNRALAIEEEHAPASLELAMTYRHVGNVHVNRGEFDEALRFHNKALTIREEKAPNSLVLAKTYANLGLVHLKQAKYEEALKWHTQACTIREEKAPDSLDLATTYDSIGLVFFEQGKYEDALPWYKKACVIEEQKSPNSLDLAITCHNIGYMYNKQGEHADALAWFTKSCVICEERAPNSLDLAATYRNISSLCKKQGMADEALRWRNKAKAIKEC